MTHSGAAPPAAIVARWSAGHTRWAATFALLALLSFPAGCSTRSEAGPPVELSGAYHIEGNVGGQMLRGTLTFPADGGYVLVTNRAVCDRRDPREVWSFDRAIRKGDELAVSCGDFRIEVDIVDGTLAETGIATRTEREGYSRASGCARYDENGNCIVSSTTDGSRSREHHGVITVTPIG